MAQDQFRELPFEVASFDAPPRVAPLAAQAQAEQGQAIAGLGQTFVAVAARLNQARETSALTQAQTQALVKFNELDRKYEHDSDFGTLTQRYEADATKLKGELLTGSGLGPDGRAHLDNFLTRMSIHSSGAVERKAYAGQQSRVVANLNESAVGFQGRYLAAGSDLERQNIVKEQNDMVAAAVGAGWLDAAQGQRAIAGFRSNVEDGELVSMIDKNPAAAAAALADPARFASLDPTLRATRLQQAQSALDHQGLAEVGNLALRSPERAALAVGKASDPATATAIFDKGVIPQESGGKAGAVSPAGALGVAQLMPGTARAAAARMGLKDVAGLDDAALKKRLLDDPALNRRLGLNEFNRLLDRFDGDVPAALAGYNAGEGNDRKPRAAAWRAAAIAKFGPGYTPEQFASVIPIKETHDYVLKIYERLGAPTNSLGLSQTARLRAQASVASAVRQEQAQYASALSAMAADYATGHPVGDLMKGGVLVDPGQISAYRQTQTLAAEQGDAHAASRLRELDALEEQAPVMAQAYRMAPADLSTLVANGRARLASEGGGAADLRTQQTLEKVLSDVSSRADSDPLGLAARAGVIRVEPLPADQPLTGAFGAALRARSAQAATAASLYGTAPQPLRPDEISALKDWYAGARPSDRLGLAQQFGASLPPAEADRTFAKVAGNDRLAITAGRVAMRDGETGRKIMEGAALLEAGAVKPKVSEVRATLGELVKGKLYPSPQMQEDAIEAGLAVYAANRASASALFDATDRAGLEAAIQEVTGKVVNLNGARTPMPPGLNAAAVTRAFGSLSEADLAPMGGLQKGLDAGTLAAHAQLHALELGGTNYAVTLAGRAVMDASGTRPLILDLSKLSPSRARYASEADAIAALDRRFLPALPRSPQEADAAIPLFDQRPGAPQ